MKEPFLSEVPKTRQPIQMKQLVHFLLSLGLVLGVIMAGNWLYTLLPHGPLNTVEGARQAQDYPALEREYARLVGTDPTNLEYQRGLIDAHLATPKVQHTKYRDIIRDDTVLLKQYNDNTQSPLLKTRDLGFYGLGYFYARTNDSQKALSYFEKVSDPALPYLNNSLGSLYMNWKKDAAKAEGYFRKEIALKGNLQGAVNNLTQLYWRGGKIGELEKLSQDPALGPLVPLHSLRYLYLAEGRFFHYLWSLFQSESSYSPTSLLASLAIALMFLIYIYFVDVFEKGKISLLLSLFGLGMLSAVGATVLYDFAGCYFGFNLEGDSLHRLSYFIFGVGVFEEGVKALPVLAAVYLWKKWDEPVDIFVFAAVSALGFACLENAGYFTRFSINLVMGRTLTAVVMHIGMTCLAFYGLFIHRYKPGAKNPVYVFLFFGAAVLVHGLYDFFASGSPGLEIFSVLILILMMMLFRNMVENALDQADFNYPGLLKLTLAGYLFYGLLGILLMQFFILDVQYGPDLALSNLGRNVARLYILFIILITDFGYLKIVKHKWRPIFDRKNA